MKVINHQIDFSLPYVEYQYIVEMLEDSLFQTFKGIVKKHNKTRSFSQCKNQLESYPHCQIYYDFTYHIPKKYDYLWEELKEIYDEFEKIDN